jgi:hypothetical protein
VARQVIESTTSTPRTAAGTVLREVAVISGRKVVTLSRVAALEPGHRLTLEYVEGMLSVGGEYRVEPHAGGELIYVLEVQRFGISVLAAPYLRHSGKKKISMSLANPRRHVEQIHAV